MLIILPPSETKAFGGDGPTLNLASLSLHSLQENRENIVDVQRNYDVDEAMKALKISETLRPEAEENTKLLTGPTMPALRSEERRVGKGSSWRAAPGVHTAE